MAVLTNWQSKAETIGQQWGLPPGLFSSFIQEESSGNPQAYNHSTGASGITQTLPTHQCYPYHSDPIAAMQCAAQFLADRAGKYGSWEAALSAWHAGDGAVQRAGGQIPNTKEAGPNGKTTRQYVADIMGRVGKAAGDVASKVFTPGSSAVSPTTQKTIIISAAIVLVVIAVLAMMGHRVV